MSVLQLHMFCVELHDKRNPEQNGSVRGQEPHDLESASDKENVKDGGDYDSTEELTYNDINSNQDREY